MTNLAIAGIRGRMGQAVAQLARERDDVRVVAGIGREALSGDAAESLGCPAVVPLARAAEAVAAADVLVDFTSAAGTRELLEAAGATLRGRALVTGTTGLDDATEAALAALSGEVAVLSAANFSVGVNVLLELVARIAGALGEASYDAEIVEAHHGAKADAPSGTALALGQAVARGRGRSLEALRRDGRSGQTGERAAGEIGFHAVRGGRVVGEHRVLFLGARETVEVRHEALDRALFADGALRAAVWLHGRAPGRYGMKDALGL